MSSARFLRSGIHWARGNHNRGPARNLAWSSEDVSRMFPNKEDESKKRKRTDSNFETLGKLTDSMNLEGMEEIANSINSGASGNLSPTTNSSAAASLLVTPPAFLTVKSLSSELPDISGGDDAGDMFASLDTLNSSSSSAKSSSSASMEMFPIEPLGNLDDDDFLGSGQDGDEDFMNLFNGLSTPPLSRTTSGGSLAGDFSRTVSSSSSSSSSSRTTTTTFPPPLKMKKASKSSTRRAATVSQKRKLTAVSSKAKQAVSVKVSKPTGDRRGRKNFRERQRRQTMKEKFDELTQLVGADADGQDKMKKMDVLAKAIDTIKTLQLQVQSLSKDEDMRYIDEGRRG